MLNPECVIVRDYCDILRDNIFGSQEVIGTTQSLVALRSAQISDIQRVSLTE